MKCAPLPRAPRWVVGVGIALVVALVIVLLVRARVLNFPTSWDGFENGDGGGARLIYVYMDGCGWCGKFTPVWKEFVERYGDSLSAAGVKAVKLRNDDDDAKALGVNGYPSVVLVSPGAALSDGTRFEGPRTVDGLAAFVALNVPAFQA